MTGIEIAMIAGAAISAMGAMQQGKAASDAANYNAQVAQQNSNLAIQAGNEQVKREQRAEAQRRGTQIAFGSSGIGLLDQLEDSAKEERLNQNSILHAATLKSIGLNNQAGLLKSEGANAKVAGNFSAAGSLLQGGVKAGKSMDARGAFDSAPSPSLTLPSNFGRG